MPAVRKHAPIALAAAVLAGAFLALASDWFFDHDIGVAAIIAAAGLVGLLLAPPAMQLWFGLRGLGFAFFAWFVCAVAVVTVIWAAGSRIYDLWWFWSAQLALTSVVGAAMLIGRRFGRLLSSFPIAVLLVGLVLASTGASWILMSWSDASSGEDLSALGTAGRLTLGIAIPFACFGVARPLVGRFGVWAVIVAGGVLMITLGGAISAWVYRERAVAWSVTAVGPGGRSVDIERTESESCDGSLRAVVEERTARRLRIRVTDRLARGGCDAWLSSSTTTTLALRPPLSGQTIVGRDHISRRFPLRSAGDRMRMPRVIGLDLADARAALGHGRRRLGVVAVVGRPGGHAVIGQSPAPGMPIGPKNARNWHPWMRNAITLTTG